MRSYAEELEDDWLLLQLERMKGQLQLQHERIQSGATNSRGRAYDQHNQSIVFEAITRIRESGEDQVINWCSRTGLPHVIRLDLDIIPVAPAGWEAGEGKIVMVSIGTKVRMQLPDNAPRLHGALRPIVVNALERWERSNGGEQARQAANEDMLTVH
jgi:hypothetical protein